MSLLMVIFAASFAMASDNIVNMIKKEGFPVEIHSIITDDNYIVNVHRIPLKVRSAKVVLIKHGLFNSAADFVFGGRNRSLAYLLFDNGFDVWLLNARGTKFSRQHQTLTYHDFKYWNFSWHEIGIYDLPAVIDDILIKTNQTSLHYIGYSEGTTEILVMLSMKPVYNPKLKTIHLLAPAIFMKHTSPVIKTSASFVDQFENMVKTMQYGDILEIRPEFRNFLGFMCNSKILNVNVCKDNNNFSPTAKSSIFEGNSVLFQNFPNTASYKQLIHYAQVVKAGGDQFLQYDHKPHANIIFYGQSSPPLYNLSNVNTKISFFYGDEDRITHQLDVAMLMKVLRSQTIGVVKIIGWDHVDFFMNKDVNKYCNKKILDLMVKHND